RVDHAGDQIVIDRGFLAGDALGHHYALFHALMRQHRAAHDIADCINAGHFRFAILVDKNQPALIERDTAVGCEQALALRTAANSDNKLVEHFLLLALGIGVADRNLSILHFTASHAGAEADIQPLLGQRALRVLGDLAIHHRQKFLECFQHHDLRADTRPHAAEFEADDTGADHAQTFGHFGEFECTGGIDDDFLIDRRRRNMHRHRTGGDDDVVGFDDFAGAVLLGHFHALAAQHLAGTFDDIDAVGLEQLADTAGELFDDIVLALDHRRHVDFHRL